MSATSSGTAAAAGRKNEAPGSRARGEGEYRNRQDHNQDAGDRRTSQARNEGAPLSPRECLALAEGGWLDAGEAFTWLTIANDPKSTRAEVEEAEDRLDVLARKPRPLLAEVSAAPTPHGRREVLAFAGRTLGALLAAIDALGGHQPAVDAIALALEQVLLARDAAALAVRKGVAS